jgi:hypothetical protein
VDSRKKLFQCSEGPPPWLTVVVILFLPLVLPLQIHAAARDGVANDQSAALSDSDGWQASLENAAREIGIQLFTPSAGSYADSQYTFYRDSDGNSTSIVDSDISAVSDGLQVVAHSQNVYATDLYGSERLTIRSIAFSRGLGEVWTLGGSIGGASLSGLNQIPVGSIKTEGTVLGSSVTASFTHGMVESSAHALREGITLSGLALEASRPVFGGLSLAGTIHRLTYSDRNRATIAQVSPQYAFDFFGTSNSIGYRLNYQSFRQDSGGAYYAPNLLLAHQTFWSLSCESPTYYGSFELAGGRQLARAFGTTETHLTASGSATIGVHATRRLAVEFSVDGEDDGFESPSLGWSFISTTLRLKFAL